ncbi:MAG: SLC13/DASS family transporter [Duodenibacillus sp.]|nr:SLC13/DASS family transporter [Duodenibacillus sp.]
MQHESSIEIGALSNKTKVIPLLLGPLVALALFFLLPETYINTKGEVAQFSVAGRACSAITIWMAIWWFTEAIPIAVTALLPIVLFPMFNIASSAATLKHYASSTIFLFLGGFLLAGSIARWGLDRRIAMLTIRIVGTKPQQMILGIFIATAFLSAWVSNTATAAMMLPIAIAIMSVVRTTRANAPVDKAEHNFGVAMLLAVAYGASLGGVVTLIGTPPNGIFARFVEQTYGQTVNFVDWMLLAFPIIAAMMAATYFMFVKWLFREQISEIPGGREWISKELKNLGPLTRGEKIVLAVFVCTALLWTFGPQLRALEIGGIKPFKPLSDAIIAMGAGILLFIIPVDIKKGQHALDWKTAQDAVSWDVLLLFGGGLSLSAAIQSTGTSSVIGAQAIALAGLPEWGIITGVTTLSVFASEFTSNTALAATLMPLVAAMAESLNVSPEGVLVGATLGASCAFMMPVGTPPNAMVFGTGHIKIAEMIRAGFWLNIIAIVIIVVGVMLLSGNILPT